MKKVIGKLKISVEVNCPKCDEVIDLTDIQKFTDDGFIYDEVLEGKKGLGCDDLNEEVTCPVCDHVFTVGAITW